LISSVRNTEIITGAMFMVSKDQVAIPVVPEKCN
jgi:F0F1-type ATP synthase gamma subunit